MDHERKERRGLDQYQHELALWMIDMRAEFSRINADEDLTPEDKKRLKEFYLQTCVTPSIQQAMRKNFPEEFDAGQRTGTPKPKSAS